MTALLLISWFNKCLLTVLGPGPELRAKSKGHLWDYKETARVWPGRWLSTQRRRRKVDVLLKTWRIDKNELQLKSQWIHGMQYRSPLLTRNSEGSATWSRTNPLVKELQSIVEKCKQCKCPSMGDWYIQTMKYYWAMKMNKLLTWATTWTDLKGIMLNEENVHLKKSHAVWFHWHHIL